MTVQSESPATTMANHGVWEDISLNVHSSGPRMMMMMMMTCAAVFVPWSRNTPPLEGWGGVLRDKTETTAHVRD